MKSNLIKNTLKGIGLSLFMAGGLIAFSSVEANAQWRNNDDREERREEREERREERQERRDDRNDGYQSNLYRIARENGLRDGQQAGRTDRRDRDRDDAKRTREYRNATNGYYNRLGNRSQYQNIYRQAYLEGYNQTYNRNRRNNNYGYGY